MFAVSKFHCIILVVANAILGSNGLQIEFALSTNDPLAKYTVIVQDAETKDTLSLGVVLNEYIIVTVANRLMRKKKYLQASGVSIRVGAESFKNCVNDDFKFKEVLVAEVKVHPEYIESKSKAFNIALLKLKGRLRLDDKLAQSVPSLGKFHEINEKSSCTGYGFGYMKLEYCNDNTLFEGDAFYSAFIVKSQDVCQLDNVENETLFCADAVNANSLLGLPGAPVMCNGIWEGIMISPNPICNTRRYFINIASVQCWIWESGNYPEVKPCRND